MTPDEAEQGPPASTGHPLSQRYQPHVRQVLAQRLKEKLGETESLPPFELRRMTAWDQWASFLIEEGRYLEAEDPRHQLLKAARTLYGPGHTRVGPRLGDLAAVYSNLGRFRWAESLLSQWLSILEREAVQWGAPVGQLLVRRAELFRRLGKYQDAETDLNRAQKIFHIVHGHVHPDLAELHLIWSRLKADRAQPEAATRSVHMAVAIMKESFGETDPRTATVFEDMGRLAEQRGEWGESESYYTRALHNRESGQGMTHPALLPVLRALAGLDINRRRYRRALRTLDRAEAIAKGFLSPQHPDLATLWIGRGQVLALQKRFEKAEEVYQNAWVLLEKSLGPASPALASTLSHLADLYYSRDCFAEADALTIRALSIYQKSLDPDHPMVADCLRNMTLSYQAQDKPLHAEESSARLKAIEARLAFR